MTPNGFGLECSSLKLMAELVQPQLGHRIADPACGTGGFLLGAYQYIVTQLALKAGAKNLQPDEDGFVRTSVSAGLTEKSQAILSQSLFGYLKRLFLIGFRRGLKLNQIGRKDVFLGETKAFGRPFIVFAHREPSLHSRKRIFLHKLLGQGTHKVGIAAVILVWNVSDHDRVPKPMEIFLFFTRSAGRGK